MIYKNPIQIPNDLSISSKSQIKKPKTVSVKEFIKTRLDQTAINEMCIA